MRPIFNDSNLEKAFLHDGFVVVDFLTADQIGLLRELHERDQSMASENFYMTVWRDQPVQRQATHKSILDIISSSYERILVDYRPVISSFAVKRPGVDSSWHPHQDDTFVDERIFVSLSIWFPLIHTSAENGTLMVLPGSHLHYRGPRSPNIPQPFKDDLENIKAQLIDIDLDPGQAIIFDHRLIHASRQNLSDKERVAAVVVLKPREADLIYVYLDNVSIPMTLKKYVISERYYLEAPLGRFSKEPESTDFRLIESYPFDVNPEWNRIKA